MDGSNDLNKALSSGDVTIQVSAIIIGAFNSFSLVINSLSHEELIAPLLYLTCQVSKGTLLDQKPNQSPSQPFYTSVQHDMETFGLINLTSTHSTEQTLVS